MRKYVNLAMVIVVAGCCVGNAFAAWIDDDFDDGTIDSSLWISADAVEAGTAVTIGSQTGSGKVVSRGDNGYSWTAGIGILEMDQAGRYQGLMTQDGGGQWLMVRTDIRGGYITLAINDDNGQRNYNFNPAAWGGNYHNTLWEIEFDNALSTVVFRGKKYGDASWTFNHTYSYSNVNDLAYMIQAQTYGGVVSQFDRLAVVPEPVTMLLLAVGILPAGLRRR